jgi:uncharacterized delta-60 repeat protein
MQYRLERLEARRLLTGGVDPTFGSPTGVAFEGPGDSPAIRQTIIDPAGRLLIAGMTTTTVGGVAQQQLFVTRIHTNGAPDPNFGDGGTFLGTPRGLNRADLIAALPGGGYFVGDILADSCVRLTPKGHLDRTFGRNGVTRLLLSPSELVARPDGKLLIVGERRPDPDFSDADEADFLARLNADGRIDRTFGDPTLGGGNGFMYLGDSNFGDGITALSALVTSAGLEPDGRLLVGFTQSVSTFNDPDNGDFVSGTDSIYVRRFLDDGTEDTTFGQPVEQHIVAVAHEAIVFNKMVTDPENEFRPGEFGLIYPRPDGDIDVVHQSDDTSKEQPVVVSRVDAAGAVSATTVNLATLAPQFHPNLQAAVLSDNSIVLAGKKNSGGGDVPELLRLRADLTLFSTFGVGGMLTLPTAGGQHTATAVHSDPDGTITAQTFGSASGAEKFVRVFADDRPVVTLNRLRGDATSVRVAVSIRGIHPIDTTSLDDNDLRLIDSLGGRRKLRLVDFVDSAGTVTATYRISRGLLAPGTYLVFVQSGQVLDDHFDANGTATQVIGKVTI